MGTITENFDDSASAGAGAWVLVGSGCDDDAALGPADMGIPPKGVPAAGAAVVACVDVEAAPGAEKPGIPAGVEGLPTTGLAELWTGLAASLKEELVGLAILLVLPESIPPVGVNALILGTDWEPILLDDGVIEEGDEVGEDVGENEDEDEDEDEGELGAAREEDKLPTVEDTPLLTVLVSP